jgi:hypothetical protein
MKTTHISRIWAQQKTGLRIILVALLLVATQTVSSQAQDRDDQAAVRIKTHDHYESYGHTLNIGVGVGYYSYIGYSVPFLGINYEIRAAKNFTLAPFIGYASYRSNDYYRYGGDKYYYHETVMPIGLKATYYFDQILGAGPNWDFYLAGSLGFNYHRVVWDDGYYGDKGISRDASPLYLDLHIGTEYHISHNLGLFLDVSTGISTIGLAVHHL